MLLRSTRSYGFQYLFPRKLYYTITRRRKESILERRCMLKKHHKVDLFATHTISSTRFFSSQTRQINSQNATTSNVKHSPPFNIMFFGTDEISLPTIKLLRKNQLTPENTPAGRRIVGHLEAACVVKQPCKLHNMPQVAQYAHQEGIVIHEIPTLKKWKVPYISQTNEPFDIAVVVSFGHLIPPSIIESFPLGGINMHPSLLPKHRGPAPIYHTILQDDRETGITVIDLHPRKFDEGKILKQIKHNISPETTYSTLASYLSHLGADAILNTLNSLNVCINEAKLQDGASSYAPKVSKQHATVDWSNTTCSEVYNKWRAFGETFGLSCILQPRNTVVRLVSLELQSNIEHGDTMINDYKRENEYQPPGSLEYDRKRKVVWIKCMDGWIACSQVRVHGKPTLPANKFVGYLSKSSYFTPMVHDDG